AHGLERLLRVAADVVAGAVALETDVVEAVVGEVVARVADRAVGLAGEQHETALGGIADRRLFALAPAIERRLGGQHRALEAGDGARHGHFGDALPRVRL